MLFIELYLLLFYNTGHNKLAMMHGKSNFKSSSNWRHTLSDAKESRLNSGSDFSNFKGIPFDQCEPFARIRPDTPDNKANDFRTT